MTAEQSVLKYHVLAWTAMGTSSRPQQQGFGQQKAGCKPTPEKVPVSRSEKDLSYSCLLYVMKYIWIWCTFGHVHHKDRLGNSFIGLVSDYSRNLNRAVRQTWFDENITTINSLI